MARNVGNVHGTNKDLNASIREHVVRAITASNSGNARSSLTFGKIKNTIEFARVVASICLQFNKEKAVVVQKYEV